jgi:hypothetical protein
MNGTLMKGFGQSVFSHQVITNFSMGALAFVLSWAVFDHFNQDPSSEAITRGLVARSAGPSRWFSPGRPQGNAVVWKDFHFVAGGRSAALIRLVLYPLLLIAAWLYSHGFLGGILIFGTPKGVTATYLHFMIVVLAIDWAMLVSRSLREEIRAQTFPTLKFLPMSTGSILYSKLYGVLLASKPGVFCLLAGIVLLPFGLNCLIDFFWDPGMSIFYLAHLILIPHVAAYLATITRWGSLPLAICFSVLSLVAIFLNLVSLNVARFSPAFPLAGLAVLSVCACCHFGVWRRVESLSASQ